MHKIHLLFEKIKGGVGAAKNLLWKEDIFIAAVIILVGFGGFGLGRLSKTEESKTPVAIRGATAPGTAIAGGGANEASYELGIMDGKNYVASVGGTKYHLPWCPGAERIKEENKIWFATEDEARAAGYSPAGNCSGL